MPADTARKERRAQRRATTDSEKADGRLRDLEQKRNRGEVSCAECRRLKLKCDRKVPCSSCVRRGCPTICPNGVLSAGQGTRYVLADTKRMHHKMIDMSDRIRQLEDALDVVQRGVSNSPHPLMTEDHLKIKQGIDAFDDSDHSDQADHDEGVCLDDFGTLTIAEHGESRFLGRSGGLEALLGCNDVSGEGIAADPPPAELQLPASLNQALSHWPFSPQNLPRTEIMNIVMSHLPSQDRAYCLAESFIENLSWHLSAVDRSQTFEDILPEFYKDGHVILNKPKEPGSQPHEFGHCPQDVSLLFMILALGAIADLEQSPQNNEAEFYHQLAKVAIALYPIYEYPTVATVQSLCLMGVYYITSGRRRTLETPWFHNHVAFSLALQIGLHRDPSRWNLPPKLAQRRRMVFWEIFNVDSWQSLASGRPTMFALRTMDCEFPEDTLQTYDDEGKPVQSLTAWKYRFAKEILHPVAYMTCAAQPLKYSEILQLDRKVREFENPPKPPRGLNYGKQGPVLFVQHLMVTSFRDIVLLYIHRNFFAKAVADNPQNPFSSQYAPSFLAAYRSSTVLIRMMSEHYQWFPTLIARFWIIWAHVLSATVMVGSIVARGPASSLAPAAFMELDLAVGLFEKAGAMVPFARRALPILLKLRKKAHDGYSSARNSTSDAGDKSNSVKLEPKDDELSIIGGATRLFEAKSPQPQQTSFAFPSPASTATHSHSSASPPMAGPEHVTDVSSELPTSSHGMPSSSSNDLAGREAAIMAYLSESAAKQQQQQSIGGVNMNRNPPTSLWQNILSSDPTSISPFTDLSSTNPIGNPPHLLHGATPLPIVDMSVSGLPSYNVPAALSMTMHVPGKMATMTTPPRTGEEVSMADILPAVGPATTDNSWMWFLQDSGLEMTDQQQLAQGMYTSLH